MAKKIEKVAIFGGTHGNERIGIELVKRFQKCPELIQYPSFEIFTFLTNPQAIKANTRYCETDLNRCFNLEDLQNLELNLYEDRLAKKIYQQVQELQIDLLIDLHSTTSNMGLTIIINDDIFSLRLAAYLSKINPKVKVLCYHSEQESSLLRSITKTGFAIEVGAIPQGVIDAKIFQDTEKMIYDLLNYIEKYNLGIPLPIPSTLTFYQTRESLDYPRDEKGEIQAMVHPRLQGQDYQELNPGDGIFLTFDGQEIIYEGKSTVYPVFINEASYYEKGIAMTLTDKQEMTLE